MSTINPDHERIREDAELALGSFWPGNASVSGYDLARYCLTLLAELEKVPVLVEALRAIKRYGTSADGIDVNYQAVTADAALAAWDETP